jgi:hypothetical protein
MITKVTTTAKYNTVLYTNIVRILVMMEQHSLPQRQFNEAWRDSQQVIGMTKRVELKIINV